MNRLGTAKMWLLVMMAESLVYSCQAVVYMTVSPYPARVYENAPPGVPVMYVSAFDNETGLGIRSFRLEPTGMAEYFHVDSGGLVTTAKTIDRVIGFQFQFFVFALLMNTVQWKHAIVEVTKKNLYPPKFQLETFPMNLYRYASPGTRLGKVIAEDEDTDPHNKHFTIFAAPRQLESQYLNVTTAGDVILTRQPAANETSLLLTVMALDDGTPPLNDSTVVAVFIRSVNLPGTFCLSTMGGGKTTLCWKNPMPGRSGPGYNVDILGPPGRVIHHHVAGDPYAEEFCVKETELWLGRNYTIQIRLDVNDTSLGGIELSFQTLGQGYSMDCLDEHFDACNFLSPCENGAQCLTGAGGGLNYSCLCPVGWQGRNCTLRDPCGAIPCQYNATCQFLGHEQHACICPPDFFGQYCQHFNMCREESERTCKNGGLCEMDKNGTHSCLCLDHFRGADCSVPDPCSPSPCGEHGTCQPENTTHATCQCYRGYYGDQCKEIDICQTSLGLCKNGGTCFRAGSNAFRCQCTDEYTGSLCEVYNACRTVCQNNATCHMTPSGGYNCSCLPAYYGNECQHFNRCHGDPCGNGTCNPDSSLPLCTCPLGYHGETCQHFNVCLTDPCGVYGTCHPSGGGPGESEDYECRCSGAWWGERCQYPNACSMGLCQNNATCLNVPPNMFSCQCLPGYYDVHCERFNPCEAAGSGSPLCHNGGLCHNTTQGHDTTQDGFWCQCPAGHYGDRCERTNPCRSSPCLNGGTCLNLTDTRYTCSCPPGYLGGQCQFLDRCQPPVISSVSGAASATLVCANGGSCATHPDSGALRCLCPEGYLGSRCQIPEPCFEGSSSNGGQSICSGQGTCTGVNRTLLEDMSDNLTDVSFLFRCDCDPGFTGRQCEVKVLQGEECVGVVCLHGGVCRTGRCHCLPTFTGSRCETAQCLAEESNLGKTGHFTWPAAAVGETVKVGCPYGARHGNDSEASRRCQLDGAGGPQWSAVDDSNCRELGLLEATRLLNYLNDLTSNPASLGTAEVNNYTTILESLFSYTLMEIEVASVMMNVISNLADVNVSVTIASNKENKTSERLLSLLDSYTAEVNVTGLDNVTITSANFELAVVNIVDLSSNFTFVPAIKVANNTKQLNASITLPPEVFAIVQTDPNRKENDVTETRLQMIGHRKSQLFIPEGSGFTLSELQHQPVLGAVLSGVVVRNLTNPVQYSITNALPNRNYTCVYWDPENRTWSTQGVETTVNSGQTTHCLSYHLTSFAVLLDPSPDYQPSVMQERVLTFISYIGSAVSLVCLTLTILTYSLFRSLNKDKSGKILLNLCVALLLLNLIFLVNALSGTQDDSGLSDGLDDNLAACTAVAVLLHYLLLASLGWMLVEAVEMYRALVTVFNKYAQCYMLKRCLLGWGVPLIIVVITLVVDVKNYQSEGAFCFISRSNLGAYYGSLVAPACVVLVVNTVIFVIVTRVILKPRFNQQKQREAEGITPAQVRGAFTVMFLLGVTWVFGPLAINEAKVVFNYLFCILNSLQGMLIFVFRCLYNPEVRSCWLQLVKTGTLKKRRGPIRSNVYSDTSSKGECKSAGSYPNGHSVVKHTLSGKEGLHGNQSMSTTATGTTKTALAHSNGWHPKLDGYSPTHSTASKQVLERRGTKFSTLGFYMNDSGDGSLKRRAAAVSEEDRYGDSILDDPSLFAQPVDYYETGHQGQVGNNAPPSPALMYRPGGQQDEGELMDYYESLRAASSVQRQSSSTTTTVASDTTNISSSTNSQTSSGSYISDTRQLIRQTEDLQEREEEEHRHSSHSQEHHQASSLRSADLQQRHDLHHHRQVTTSTSSISSASAQLRSREVTPRTEERTSGLKSDKDEHTHL